MSKISFSTSFNTQASAETDFRINGMNTKSAGTKLIQKSTCLSCHQGQNKVIGPSFAMVAEKYKSDKTAAVKLADKVLKGGAGVWGPIPMPAHTDIKKGDLAKMIKAVLATKNLAEGHKE
jgi:cytochrome c